MAKRQGKDEALEALDFIINILKEHEKDLDRLVSKLSKATEKFGKTGEVTTKVERIEERLATLQGEINNFISSITPPKDAPRPILS
ncbi:MAG: hypothetical protein JSV58_01845, partial [Candidatus Bathyarchaeota archaeon]